MTALMWRTVEPVRIWAGLSYLPTGRYVSDYWVRVGGIDVGSFSDYSEAEEFARAHACGAPVIVEAIVNDGDRR